MRVKNLTTLLAEFRIRTAQGYGYFVEFKNALIIGTALKLMFETSILLAVILTFIAYLSWFVIGWFDLKYIGLMQKIAELTTSKYNPHLAKIK